MQAHFILLALSLLSSIFMVVQRQVKYFTIYSWTTYILLSFLALYVDFSARVAATVALSLGFLLVFSILSYRCSTSLGGRLDDLNGLAFLSPKTTWLLAISCYALAMLPPFAPFILEHLINTKVEPPSVFLLELTRVMLLLGFAKIVAHGLLKAERGGSVHVKNVTPYALTVAVLIIASIILFVGVGG